MKTPNDPRHNARRVVLQTLFKWSYDPQKDILQTLDDVLGELVGTEGFDDQIDNKLAQTLLTGTVSHFSKINQVIARAAPEWPIGQIAKVDLAILRLAIFEVIHHAVTPPKVAIDEAVELAKEFGGENSPGFVNGVLGTVMEIRGDKSEARNSKHETNSKS